MDRWAFDKKILAGLNTGFQKLNNGVKTGARWAGGKASELGKKLEQNEKFSEAKRKAFEFTAQNVEKLKNVKFKDATLGEYLQQASAAGGRFTERQFLRLVAILQKVDPNFVSNSDSFNENVPLIRAFKVLHLPVTASWEDVRKAYHKHMREHHPDRHASTPDEEHFATMRTQLITESYEILERHFKGNPNWQ